MGTADQCDTCGRVFTTGDHAEMIEKLRINVVGSKVTSRTVEVLVCTPGCPTSA